MCEAAAHSLVMIVNKTPPFTLEGRTIGTSIYGWQAVLSAVGILSLQELYLDANVTTINTAEV